MAPVSLSRSLSLPSFFSSPEFPRLPVWTARSGGGGGFLAALSEAADDFSPPFHVAPLFCCPFALFSFPPFYFVVVGAAAGRLFRLLGILLFFAWLFFLFFMRRFALFSLFVYGVHVRSRIFELLRSQRVEAPRAQVRNCQVFAATRKDSHRRAAYFMGGKTHRHGTGRTGSLLCLFAQPR